MTMKKTMLRTAALAMAAFLGMAGVTQIASATDQWTQAKVGQILVWNADGSPRLSFNLEGDPRLCASASGGGTSWVVITTDYMSAEAIRNYLSIVTAAKLAGRNVTVRALNSNAPNEWGCRTDGVDLMP
jgi:hypothetical protein